MAFAIIMKGVVQMTKILTKFSRFVMEVLPALAMMMAVHSVSATCGYVIHQPDVPDELK